MKLGLEIKNMRLAVIFLLVLLLVGNASAISLSDLGFSWAGDQIEYIAPNKQLAANIDFSYTLGQGEEITSIYVNATDMNKNPYTITQYSNMPVDLNACEENENKFECSVKNLVFFTNDAKIEIEFKITYTDSTQESKVLSKTLLFDNTRPVVTFLGPKNCEEGGQCFVAAKKINTILIKMEDSVGSFDKHKIAVKLGGNTGYAHSCEDMTCITNVYAECIDGQTLPLLITNYAPNMPSQDDAGNSLTGTLSSQVKCDGKAPVVIDKKIMSSTGLNAITTSDSAIIIVNVTETISPDVKIQVIGTPINADNVTADCTNTGSQFVCSVSISPNIDVTGEYTLPLKISDSAGNVASDSVKFTLLGVSNQTSVDFWDVKTVNPSSSRLNKRNMLFDRDFVFEVELRPKGGQPEIVTLTAGSTCLPTTDNATGHQGDISKVTILKKMIDKNKVYMKVTLSDYGSLEKNRYEGLNSLSYDCPLTVVSKNYDKFYSSSEQVNFTIKFDLYSDSTFDDFLKDEINETLEAIQTRQKWIGVYGDTIGKIVTACNIIQLVPRGAAIVSTAAQVLSNVAMYTGVFDLGTTKGAALAGEAGSTAVSKGAEAIAEIIVPLCGYLTCKESINPLNNYMTDWWDDVGDDLSMDEWGGFVGVGSNTSLSEYINPWKSEVAAWSSLCLPAMVYHQEVRQGIQCTYAECLSYGVGKTGKDASDCQEERAYSECIVMSEGITNFIPFTAMFKDVATTVQEIASDPGTLFGTLGVSAYCQFLAPIIGGVGTCNAVAMFQEASDIASTISDILSAPDEDTSSCDNVFNQIDPITMQWKFLPPSNAPPDFELITPDGQSSQLYLGVDSNGKDVTSTCVLGMCRIDGKNYWVDTRSAYNSDTGMINFDKVRIYYGSSPEGLKYAGTYNEMQVALKKAQDERTGAAKKITESEFDKIMALQSIDTELKTYKNSAQKLYGELQNCNSINNPSFATTLGCISVETEYQKARQKSIDLQNQKDALNGVTHNYEELGEVAAENPEYYTQIPVSINDKGEIIIDGNPFAKIDANMAPFILKMAKQQPKVIEEFKRQLTNQYEEIDKITNGNADLTIRFNYAMDFLQEAEEWRVKLKGELSDIMRTCREKGNCNDADVKSEIEEKEFLIAEWEKEKEKELKNLKDVAKDAEQIKTWQFLWGTAADATRTTLNFGRQIATIRNMIGVTFGHWGSDSFMKDVLDTLDEAAHFERLWCEMDEGNVVDSGGSFAMNMVGQGVFEAGIYLNPRKATYSNPVGGNYYDYWISGGVSSKKKDGLSFKIKIAGPGGEKDITKDITGKSIYVIPIGKDYVFSGSGTYKFNDTRVYNTVCIDFMMTKSQIIQFFDDVKGLNDGKFCRTIVGE